MGLSSFLSLLLLIDPSIIQRHILLLTDLNLRRQLGDSFIVSVLMSVERSAIVLPIWLIASSVPSCPLRTAWITTFWRL